MSYPESNPVENFDGPALRIRPKASGRVRQTCNVVYAEALGLGLTLDVFVPEGQSNGLGLVDVVSHRWRGGRPILLEHLGLGLMDVLCAHGFTVFAVGPGSAEQFTARALARHVHAGIRFVKRRAGRYRIDPTRLAVTGVSSGGHLAALAAMHPESGHSLFGDEDSRIAAAALFFPPTDLTTLLLARFQPGHPHQLPGQFLFNGGIADRSQDEIDARLREFSPRYRIPPSPPPFFLCHGTEDHVVPFQQSLDFAAAVQEAGGSAEVLPVEGAGHSWGDLRPQLEHVAAWLGRTLHTASSPMIS